MHSIVLSVNMLSFKSHHVNKGKVKYDMPNINKRGPQASPMALTAMFVPYQKHNPAGIPNVSTEVIGRSIHHSQTNCEYSWNHAIIWATAKNKHANKILDIVYYNLTSVFG